jgi:YVTN family beta-propeller protein
MGDPMIRNSASRFLRHLALFGIVVGLVGPVTAQERVFVTNSLGNTIKILTTAPMPTMVPVEVGTQPFNVAVQPGGAFAYVVNKLDKTVSVVDTMLDSEIDTISVGRCRKTSPSRPTAPPPG